jgi:glycosyltransferase involved in cell wall biosynthesis
VRALFLSYDGALDPLGQSQIVPYLRGLAARGHAITLISFEKRERWPKRAKLEALLREAGIPWHPLPYHSGFSLATTSYDLARAYALARKLHKQSPFALCHARSYPPALVAWRLRRHFGIPFLFDIRGFYPEERVDGGLWPAGGVLFRLTKALEKKFFRDASALVTLTEASAPTLRSALHEAGSRARITVIPTCADLQLFRPLTKSSKNFQIAYVGSIGTWYLIDDMLRIARIALESADTSVLFLTNDGGDLLLARAGAAGIDTSRFAIRSVSHEEVPKALAHCDATFFAIKPVFSKQASAATKFGESLALGLPALVNTGVGDAARIVSERRVGVAVSSFDDAALREAITKLRALCTEADIRARCRAAAEEIFSLTRGVDKYDAIYRELGA